MTPGTFASLEGFESHGSRKKRLGQYFSGARVARLLAALASRPGTQSAIDPMAGQGDMLLATREIIPTCTNLSAVEIDPIAEEACANRLKQVPDASSLSLRGSAFDPKVVSQLSPSGYDLVITNPPYVRYQSQKSSAGEIARLPSAIEVRNGLRESMAVLTTLDNDDRELFSTLAENYSGLSDLAVPSWILCAALVKVGGTLAMVVPDAWLNRDYAGIVQYLLLRCFRIEFVVEDSHASWFSDALVRTTLLVAQRTKQRESAMDWTDETYLRLAIPSTLSDGRSLVGRLKPQAKSYTEITFATSARKALAKRQKTVCPEVATQRVLIADQAAAMRQMVRREAWFMQLESSTVASPSVSLPPQLAHIVPRSFEFKTFNQLGVSIGQGLRTGANEFFYADVVKREKESTTVRLSKLFGGSELVVPTAALLPVIRKQSDVPAGAYVVNQNDPIGVVLALQKWALPEDSGRVYQQVPDALAAHIRVAAATRVGDGSASRTLPELTAVAPNSRKANPRTGAPQRFWYMLPEFAPRHRPDLFIPRVNSDSPKVVLNAAKGVLADANFVTLWCKPDASVSAEFLIAYLNSSFAAAIFEHVGSILGGGALKIEATHLRVFPVPPFSAEDASKVTALGKAIASNETPGKKWQDRLDSIVYRTIFGAKGVRIGKDLVESALDVKLQARQHRN